MIGFQIKWMAVTMGGPANIGGWPFKNFYRCICAKSLFYTSETLFWWVLTEVAVSVGVDFIFVWVVEGAGRKVVHLNRPGPVVWPWGPHHHQLLKMTTPIQTATFETSTLGLHCSRSRQKFKWSLVPSAMRLWNVYNVVLLGLLF